jgi:hypothetical protein
MTFPEEEWGKSDGHTMPAGLYLYVFKRVENARTMMECRRGGCAPTAFKDFGREKAITKHAHLLYVIGGTHAPSGGEAVGTVRLIRQRRPSGSSFCSFYLPHGLYLLFFPALCSRLFIIQIPPESE